MTLVHKWCYSTVFEEISRYNVTAFAGFTVLQLFLIFTHWILFMVDSYNLIFYFIFNGQRMCDDLQYLQDTFIFNRSGIMVFQKIPVFHPDIHTVFPFQQNDQLIEPKLNKLQPVVFPGSVQPGIDLFDPGGVIPFIAGKLIPRL